MFSGRGILLQFVFCSFILSSTFCSSPLSAAEQTLNGHKFTLPDGLVIEEVAGPGLVDRPICADFDERGRLYIADSSGSNEKVQIQLEKRPHRVVRLEDTNFDGVYDKSTLFADKMMFPEGAMWHDGSLYVAAPPQIWKLTDTNDDGVADKREVWFDGKTLTGCANDLHGPYMGPDGWIYWCKGAFAEQTHKQEDGTDFISRAAHVFRRRPEGGPVEPVMTGGMDNPVELAFSPGGERFFTTTFFVHPGSGLRDGIIHSIYGGVYGKVHGVLDGHARTGSIMPNLINMGAAAPCGLNRLESDQLGTEYQNNLFACAFNMHKVSRVPLVPKGATYESSVEDFVVSDNIDFHPTDVLEDADGSLIIIDTGGWYKLCCPTSQFSKPDIYGAVYRVTKKGSHQQKDPRGRRIKWAEQSVSQLVSHLGDARQVVQKRAKLQLAELGEKSVPVLKQTLKSSQNANQRLQTVWALTQIDASSARAAVRVALSDSDETVRQAALHSISVHRDRNAEADVVKQLKSESAHNRRAAGEALGRIGTAESVSNILDATTTSTGRVLEHSLIYALLEINDVPSLRKALESSEPSAKRAAIIALDQLPGDNLKFADVSPLLDSKEAVLNETAWWVTNRHAEWADGLQDYFRDQFAQNHTDRETLATLLERLTTFVKNSSIQKLLGETLKSDSKANSETRTVILKAMEKSRLKQIPEPWAVPLFDQLNTADPVLLSSAVSTVLSLSSSKPADNFVTRLIEISNNEALPALVRLQALNAVPASRRSFDEEVFTFLCENISLDEQTRIRALAVDVIVSSKLDAVQLSTVIEHLDSTGPMELKRLMEMFGKQTEAQVGQRLVTALANHSAMTSLSADQLKKQLAGFGPSISAGADLLYARIEKENADKIARIDEILKLTPEGDILNGQKVFNSQKTSCIVCHGMGYIGGNVGPDLSRIGSVRTERDLLEAILFPSVSFVRSYEPVVIITTEGLIYNGVIKDETDVELVLQLDAQKSVRIPLEDIDERNAGKVSLMPQGLEKQLTAKELADLVVFLKSRK